MAIDATRAGRSCSSGRVAAQGEIDRANNATKAIIK
jgi:hypothetical protein